MKMKFSEAIFLERYKNLSKSKQSLKLNQIKTRILLCAGMTGKGRFRSDTNYACVHSRGALIYLMGQSLPVAKTCPEQCRRGRTGGIPLLCEPTRLKSTPSRLLDFCLVFCKTGCSTYRLALIEAG